MRRWATVVFWLIALSVLAVVVGPSKAFQDCISERNHYEAYQAPQEKVSFFVKAVPWTRLRAACGFVAVNENTGAITGIAGVVVAFFTFTLWLSTHRLWKSGERQAEITKTMADAAILGPRAIVQVSPMWSTEGDRNGPGANYRFFYKMENFGNTAASNVKNHIGYALLDKEMTDDFVFSDDDAPIATAGALGTRQWLFSPHVPPDKFITASEITKIRQEKLWLYFYGSIRYFDAFPGTPERVTKFCYGVRVTGDDRMPVTFPPHRHHNCADDGCDE